ERQRQAQRHRQKLLGVERDVEQLARNVEHPKHDAGHQQRLQDVGRKHGRLRGFGGELFRAGNEALLRRGGDMCRRVGSLMIVAHWYAFLTSKPWLRSSCLGSTSARRDDRSWCACDTSFPARSRSSPGPWPPCPPCCSPSCR